MPIPEKTEKRNNKKKTLSGGRLGANYRYYFGEGPAETQKVMALSNQQS